MLIAHLTPGHTMGTTAWTLKAREARKSYDVVILGSAQVNDGYQLVNNAAYPETSRDYEKTFRILKSLDCDVFLGVHPSYYNMEAKYARIESGDGNPFLDADGYKRYVAGRERAFQRELARQEAART